VGKRGRNLKRKTVKIGNMKYIERKIRQNKSGKKIINMHENTYGIRKACKRFPFILELKLRIMN
jgi:predicted nucleic-acid-binding Zn-ribbon protein